jgi:hypothetical protein
MTVTFVDQTEQLPGMAAAVLASPRMALDIEWRPDGLYDSPDNCTQSPASILQLAIDGQGADKPAQVYIVDLLAIAVCFHFQADFMSVFASKAATTCLFLAS